MSPPQHCQRLTAMTPRSRWTKGGTRYRSLATMFLPTPLLFVRCSLPCLFVPSYLWLGQYLLDPPEPAHPSFYPGKTRENPYPYSAGSGFQRVGYRLPLGYPRVRNDTGKPEGETGSNLTLTRMTRTLTYGGSHPHPKSTGFTKTAVNPRLFHSLRQKDMYATHLWCPPSRRTHVSSSSSGFQQRHHEPRHRYARMLVTERRQRVKGRSCRPSENTRSTPVDVAGTLR